MTHSHNCSRCHLPGHYAKKCPLPPPAPDPMLFSVSPEPEHSAVIQTRAGCPTCQKVVDTLREAGLIE